MSNSDAHQRHPQHSHAEFGPLSNEYPWKYTIIDGDRHSRRHINTSIEQYKIVRGMMKTTLHYIDRYHLDKPCTEGNPKSMNDDHSNFPLLSQDDLTDEDMALINARDEIGQRVIAIQESAVKALNSMGAPAIQPYEGANVPGLKDCGDRLLRNWFAHSYQVIDRNVYWGNVFVEISRKYRVWLPKTEERIRLLERALEDPSVW